MMHLRTLFRRCRAVLLLAVLPLAGLGAQRQRSTLAPQLEARLDANVAPVVGGLVGVGLNVRAGWYARVGIAASAGVLERDSGWEDVQRLDLTARFLFDPFGESTRAFYAGAGLGVVRRAEDDVRALLLGVVGVEGANRGRVVPAFELTLGDGVRLGVVLRGRRPQGR